MIVFNSDEDLVLLTTEGRVYFIDIFLGKIKEKYAFSGFGGKNDLIDEGKL
jgi:hypothetical protein